MMESQDETLDAYVWLIAESVWQQARDAGLDCSDAAECAAAYRRRGLFGKRREELTIADDVSSRRVQRKVRWFVRQWIHDRTTAAEGTGGAGGGDTESGRGGELRNVDMETIGKIVSTLSVSQRWLWRRVEVEGASLKELAAETNMTAKDLNRALYYVRRAIRRALDADERDQGLGIRD